MMGQEWQSCARPELLLRQVSHSSPGRALKRMLRLFICGCCRQAPGLMADPACARAVEVAERYADGQATPIERDAARWALHAVDRRLRRLLPVSELAALAAAAAVPTSGLRAAAERVVSGVARRRTQARLGPFQVLRAEEWRRVRAGERQGLCDLVRDVFPNPFSPLGPIPTAVLAWNGSCVVNLATAIYEGRDFSPGRMGVLADALEDAGVTDERILQHCRGQGMAHARGCWLIDSLTCRG
jgi:hypothetical protein